MSISVAYFNKFRLKGFMCDDGFEYRRTSIYENPDKMPTPRAKKIPSLTKSMDFDNNTGKIKKFIEQKG
jgi:hypothetical protein